MLIVLIVKFFRNVMIFLSTYTNKIDAKGRVSVPSSFRGVLEESGFKGLICYPSPILNSIEGCGFNRIKKLSDTIDALGPFLLSVVHFQPHYWQTVINYHLILRAESYYQTTLLNLQVLRKKFHLLEWVKLFRCGIQINIANSKIRHLSNRKKV